MNCKYHPETDAAVFCEKNQAGFCGEYCLIWALAKEREKRKNF